jgi:hypothetical protein
MHGPARLPHVGWGIEREADAGYPIGDRNRGRYMDTSAIQLEKYYDNPERRITFDVGVIVGDMPVRWTTQTCAGCQC